MENTGNDVWSRFVDIRATRIKISSRKSWNSMSTVEKSVLSCSFLPLLLSASTLLFYIDWARIRKLAFDMFQSLNATGTPLLLHFQPLVVSLVASNNGGFKGSKSEEYFEQVDQLLGSLRSASSKNKLTNDYLTVFALTHDGTKLSTQFSAQRRLTEKYNGCTSVAEQEEFIRRMGDLATYCKGNQFWSK